VISCDRSSLQGIQQVSGKYGLSANEIGETVSDQVEIKLDGSVVVSAAVKELRNAYEGALQAALQADPDAVVAG
jgi:type II secretory ATPase GspE/PulE/Tfp pilus assembly ATPase PilB-like protein